MAVNSPKLQKYKKCFTKQDYLDGKCTKEGAPLAKESLNDPEVKPEVLEEVKEAEASQAEPEAASETSADDGASVPKSDDPTEEVK